MKKIVSLLAVVLSFGCLTGCVQRVTDFTVISSKNFDLSRGSQYVMSDKRAEGTDTKAIILIPLGVPNAKEALDNAIQSVPGCIALSDGVLESEFFSFFFGYIQYRAKGTCIIDPKLVVQR